MVLDAFFKVAVPLTIVGAAVAKLMIAVNRRRPFYPTAADERRRDAINRRYRTNRAALIIAVIFLLAWMVIVASLVEQWGAKLLTLLVSVFMILPVGTVCCVVILLYSSAVHLVANAKR